MIRATLNTLMQDRMLDDAPAIALCIEAGTATGHFAKFVGDENLCDEICYSQPIRFLIREPADPLRVQRLLDVYNAWPWPAVD